MFRCGSWLKSSSTRPGGSGRRYALQFRRCAWPHAHVSARYSEPASAGCSSWRVSGRPPTRCRPGWRTRSSGASSGVFRADRHVPVRQPAVERMRVPDVIPELTRKDRRPGGVYLGVGPEQNFTYIAALRPRMAFIIDIRRGNLDLHLMYKALFELSADRAEFVSPPVLQKAAGRADRRSRRRRRSSTRLSRHDERRGAVQSRTSGRSVSHLTRTHGFPLSADDCCGSQHDLSRVLSVRAGHPVHRRTRRRAAAAASRPTPS